MPPLAASQAAMQGFFYFLRAECTEDLSCCSALGGEEPENASNGSLFPARNE